MTAVEWLAEQFDNIVELYPSQFEKVNKAINQAKEMENQQQDKFAIEFAEWCIKWRVKIEDDTRLGLIYSIGGTYSKYKINELLEQFKNK
jgi:hypothetical protein